MTCEGNRKRKEGEQTDDHLPTAARPAKRTMKRSLYPYSAPAEMSVAQLPGSIYATAETRPGPTNRRCLVESAELGFGSKIVDTLYLPHKEKSDSGECDHLEETFVPSGRGVSQTSDVCRYCCVQLPSALCARCLKERKRRDHCQSVLSKQWDEVCDPTANNQCRPHLNGIKFTFSLNRAVVPCLTYYLRRNTTTQSSMHLGSIHIHARLLVSRLVILHQLTVHLALGNLLNG